MRARTPFIFFSGAVSCYCCERYSVRIPKIKKQPAIAEDEREDPCVALTTAEWRVSAELETDC